MSAKQNEQQNVEHKTEIAKKKSSAEQETTVTEELTAALEEIVEEPKAEKVKGELVTLLDDSNFLIGERHYRLVSDYREGFNAEKLGERYSDVLARYDYIVGDWGYEQLRLKGFFQADNRRAHPDQRKKRKKTIIVRISMRKKDQSHLIAKNRLLKIEKQSQQKPLKK